MDTDSRSLPTDPVFVSELLYRPRRLVKGRVENVTAFDRQRDLTARKDVHTRCPCTYGKLMGPYHSHEAHKRYLLPRDMAINDHQLTESSDR